MDLAFENAWENDTTITDDRPTSPVLEPKQESYVGAAPREIDDLYERRHKDLAAAWADLRDRAQMIDSWDVSIKAASEVLAVRVHQVAHALGLLARVSNMAKDQSLADAFASDAPLTAYLAGSYLWLDGVVSALSSLATQLAQMSPEWSLFRGRLEEITWIHELAEREQDATPVAWLPDHTAAYVRQLFKAIAAVKEGIDKPFG